MELERNRAGKLKVARRAFTLDYKADVVRHKKAENLSFVETGKKFDVLQKLVQQREKQYEAGELTKDAGRRTVPPRAGRDRTHEGRELAVEDGGVHPKKRSSVFRAGVAVKYAFIERVSGGGVSAAGNLPRVAGDASGLSRLVEASRLGHERCSRRAGRIDSARV